MSARPVRRSTRDAWKNRNYHSEISHSMTQVKNFYASWIAREEATCLHRLWKQSELMIACFSFIFLWLRCNVSSAKGLKASSIEKKWIDNSTYHVHRNDRFLMSQATLSLGRKVLYLKGEKSFYSLPLTFDLERKPTFSFPTYGLDEDVNHLLKSVTAVYENVRHLRHLTSKWLADGALSFI